MSSSKIIIAIDGYASTGKSSFAKSIAARLNYTYVDSGALYRCISLYALNRGIIDSNGSFESSALERILPEIHISFNRGTDGKSRTLMNGEDVEAAIRSLEVSSVVSPVSEIPAVRNFVDNLLHVWGKEKGIVMDGRDIGTAVFPNAELKIFMTASEDVRAMRRLKEMQEKGMSAKYEDVLENLRNRDWTDSHRQTNPLRQATDAIVLDNSNMTISQQMEWIEGLFPKYGLE